MVVRTVQVAVAPGAVEGDGKGREPSGEHRASDAGSWAVLFVVLLAWVRVLGSARPGHTPHYTPQTQTPHRQAGQKTKRETTQLRARAGSWVESVGCCCWNSLSLSMKFQASRFSASGRKCPSSPTIVKHAAHASPCMFSRLERDVGKSFGLAA